MSNDLISRQWLLDNYKDLTGNNLNGHRKVTIASVRHLIESAPVAYDVEKVSEQLEEASYWTMPTYDEDGFGNDDEEEVIHKDTALNIVLGDSR